MAGTIFVNDNAGVFVRLIDKSQRPVEPRPNVMSGAFAINAERGLMNTIHYVRNDAERELFFGKKNWRTLGKSMYDLSKYLEGGRPAYVVRVGKTTGPTVVEVSETVTATSETLAYASIYVNTSSGKIVEPEAVSEGKSYSEIKDSFQTDAEGNVELCRIFAKGEGTWGNNIRITIEQKYTDDKYVKGDKFRIFSLTFSEKTSGAKYTILESYDVSFNPKDISKSGLLYIGNVLANSPYVGVVINDDIDPDNTALTVEPAVNSKGERIWEVALCGGAATLLDTNLTERSKLFENGLRRIFENYIETDPWLAFNAGQEIENVRFSELFGDPLEFPGVTDRCLGITAVPELKSYEIPTDNGGVGSRWCAKLFQWLECYDSDTQTDVMTSPVGWLGRTIAAQDIAGEGSKAPAGYRRGVIGGVKRISKDVKAADRVKVVNFKWNPIKKDPTGYVFWDALTSEPLNTSFSNIHVMLAYQRIRRGIEAILKDFTFENNDESTVGTMLSLLRNAADAYVSQGYAEEIVVDAAENRYGTDQIRLRYNVRFKEAARTIVVDVIAYRSDQPLSVSMAE
jgi:hypothetical protein